jgi:hypothetical protein
LFGAINGQKNMFVLVLTHYEKVANEICGLNGGVRVASLPLCLEGEKITLKWLGMWWKRTLLIALIRKRHPLKIERDETVEFVKKGMTPLDIIKQAERLLYKKRKKNLSPQRKSQSFAQNPISPYL